MKSPYDPIRATTPHPHTCQCDDCMADWTTIYKCPYCTAKSARHEPRDTVRCDNCGRMIYGPDHVVPTADVHPDDVERLLREHDINRIHAGDA